MKQHLCVLLILLTPLTAVADDLTLSDFLSKAWESGPVRRGETLQTDASDEFVSSARGKYLPHVSLDAIDSNGFPASNSGLGVGGLMASPFRSGAAGGVVVQQTVYDFGRIQSALAQAKADKSLNLARVAADKFQFLYTIGQMYLSCAHSRSLQRIDGQLMDWARVNLKETERFTKTGQESIVDNSLVKTEVSVLKLELDQLQNYQTSLQEQMKLFGGSSCRRLSETVEQHLPDALKVEEPTILLARAQAELSHANYESAKSNQLPSLQVMGSAGDMEHVRLVDKEDYAVGVGLTFPIWNGGEDARREQGYKLQTEYQNENLKTARLEYMARLKNLRDEFDRRKSTVTALDLDLDQVRENMKVATRRYKTLQGTLIDVREAFKQLQLIELRRVDELRALGGVSLQLALLQTTGVEQ